jgi:hypothetical protein
VGGVAEASMVEALDVMDAFSTTLKLAWVVWLGWGIGQVFWYKRERTAAVPKPAPKAAALKTVPPARRRTTPIEAALPAEPAEELAPIGRLITPQTPADAPTFDPGKAVLETFSQST